MVTQRIDPPRGEEQHSSSLRQETVVTHEPDRDTTERQSVGIPASSAATRTTAPSIETSRTVVRDEVGGRHRRVAQITQIIWFVVGLFEVMLALRLILKLTAAGQTDFTQMALGVTRPFVMPFLGMFPNAATDGFEFEPASVVAMAVYFLVGLGLVQLARILYGETRETA